MKYALIFLCSLLITLGATAQQMHINYTRMIGGTGGEICNDVVYDTTDKSILFTGYTADSCGTGDLPPCPPVTGRRDLLVGKLDSNRNLVWIRQYGGSSDDVGGYIQTNTNNNGYFLLGGTNSLDGDVVGSHGSDIWFLKLNNQGNIQWSKCYGSSNGQEVPGKGMQTQDGGYIIIGNSSGSGDDVPFQYINSPFTIDWFILKIDSLGNKQWAKTIGGTGDEGFKVSIYQIGNYYYVAGYSASHDHECSDESWHPGHNNTGGDYFLIKLDSAGNYLWNKSYGGTGDDQMEDAVYDERDSTIVMAGHSTSYDYMVPQTPSSLGDANIWVLKLKLDGSIVWSKVLGDNSSEKRVRINKSSINKGYLVTCEADFNNPIPSYYYGGGVDDRLFLIDSSGALIADKVIGGTSQEYWGTAIQLDKGFAVVGSSSSNPFGEGITTPLHGMGIAPDIYASYLDFWSASVPTITDEQSNLKVYPNPAENKITIELNHNEKGSLRVTDMTGKIVWQQTVRGGANKWNINTQGWQRGSYIIQWTDESGRTTNKKLLLR